MFFKPTGSAFKWILSNHITKYGHTCPTTDTPKEIRGGQKDREEKLQNKPK